MLAWFLSSRNIELLDHRLSFLQLHSKFASIWVGRLGCVQEQNKGNQFTKPILRDAETLGRAEYLTIRAGGDAEDGKTLFLVFVGNLLISPG